MTTISSLGVGSGLDAESLVTRLMSVEKMPLTALQAKGTATNTKISAYGSISSLVDTLSSKLNTLKSANSLAAFSATSSNTDSLTATASNSASAGKYDISVSRIATTHKLSASAIPKDDVLGSGDLAVSLDGGAQTVISVSNSSAKLSDWRDAINAAGAGVTATIINSGTNSYLTIKANETGREISLDTDGGTVSGNPFVSAPSIFSSLTSNVVADDPLVVANPETVSQKLSAKYTVDGVEVVSKSNSDSDTISGVTLNLVKGDSTTPINSTLTVARDTSKMSSALNDFVTAYNDLNSKIKSLTAYDSANKKSSTLTGDSTVKMLQSRISSLVGAKQAGTGTHAYLADIGISFNKDGSLSLDSSKLTAAISKDSSSVTSVISSASSELYKVTSAMTKADGILTTKTNSLQMNIKDFKNREDALNLRLDAIEKRYRTMFSSLDTTVSSMQTTSSYLTQALAKL